MWNSRIPALTRNLTLQLNCEIKSRHWALLLVISSCLVPSNTKSCTLCVNNCFGKKTNKKKISDRSFKLVHHNDQTAHLWFPATFNILKTQTVGIFFVIKLTPRPCISLPLKHYCSKYCVNVLLIAQDYNLQREWLLDLLNYHQLASRQWIIVKHSVI